MLPLKKKIFKFIYPFIPFLYLRIFILKKCGYRIGHKCYIPASLKISDLKTRRNNIIIGDRVSFGPEILLITDSSPNYSKLKKKYPLISGNITIGNDSWIGARTTILPGVQIGECSIIGAGSLVNKNVPPFSIATGIPAKVLKSIDINEL